MVKKIAIVALMFFCTGPLFAADVAWKSVFNFYGDNTEFFEPFRTGETILGQQGKSFLEATVGPAGTLRVGVFYDFRSVTDPQVTVKPVLTGEFRTNTSRLIFGTLENGGRHGFLEPLSVRTLEFTRPIEYGLQWILEEESWKLDAFLDWHELNTPTRPETLDYGFVLKRALDGRLWLEAQVHGYHEGGQLYSVAFRNNWAPALGFRWKAEAEDLGTFRLAAFGVMSGDLLTSDLSGIRYGGGGYFRAGFQPPALPELFVIGWQGRDFFFQEGDLNYASFNSDKSFYRADRTYLEVGLGGTLPLGGGILLNSEMRIHWIDEYFAVSNRHSLVMPFDLTLLSGPKDEKDKKPSHEAPKR